MKKKALPLILIFVIVFLSNHFLSSASTEHFCQAVEGVAPTVLLSWEFNQPDDLAGWNGNHLTPLTLDEGAMTAKFTGQDPFVMTPDIEIPTKAGQAIEIRIKSEGELTGELFYANSNEGPYNGFSQQKTLHWDLLHDQQFHTYQIIPNWLADGKIIRLRFDLGSPTHTTGTTGFAIDYIRILDLNLDQAEPLENPNWNTSQLEALQCESSQGKPAWRSGTFLLDPKAVGNWLSFQWVKDETPLENPHPMANLRFLSNEGSGVINLSVPLSSIAPPKNIHSGQVFCQNVDLSQWKEWEGRIYCWEIALPLGCDLLSLSLTDQPQGPGALETTFAELKNPIHRIDAATGVCKIEYTFFLKNVGGEPVEDLACFLDSASAIQLKAVEIQKTLANPTLWTNPSGDRLTHIKPDDSALDKTVKQLENNNGTFVFPAELAPNEVVILTAIFETQTPDTYPLNLVLTGTQSRDNASDANAELTRLPLSFDVLPSLNLPKANAVPEPQPLQSDYEIGALYFPGWSIRAGWDKIKACDPIRKPLLGWYDESNPEVVDWQIKWASENGIQFFLVDWYWYHGNINLEHWIQAFQQAKHRSHLKWAMMWANHTGAGTHSLEDQKAVTQYWLDNYFNTPEYYTIDEKPVVVIWDPSIMDNDMIEIERKKGHNLQRGEGVKILLDLTRQMCVDAGYPGVYFIAMKWPEASTDPKDVQWLADGGFDCTMIYHFMNSGGKATNPMLFSFDHVADASLPFWQSREKTGILPFIPNLSTGWDSRPWHGFRNTVIYDRTPEQFRKICEDFKTFSQESGIKRVVLAPLNEWGEGSYIEPNTEFGFKMYEALRETLCREPEGGFPVNYTPSDVGLGPYDLPEQE